MCAESAPILVREHCVRRVMLSIAVQQWTWTWRRTASDRCYQRRLGRPRDAGSRRAGSSPGGRSSRRRSRVTAVPGTTRGVRAGRPSRPRPAGAERLRMLTTPSPQADPATTDTAHCRHSYASRRSRERVQSQPARTLTTRTRCIIPASPSNIHRSRRLVKTFTSIFVGQDQLTSVFYDPLHNIAKWSPLVDFNPWQMSEFNFTTNIAFA